MPEEKIIEYMNYCLGFIRDDKVNMLIKVAVFHYLFGYIHPFYDGRTSRFISSCLLKDELGILLSLRLSYVIKNNLKSYDNAFDICNDVKNKGEITSFILMFLTLLDEASNDLYQKLYDAKEHLDFYISILKSVKMKKHKDTLLYVLCQNNLFGNTFVMFDELISILAISKTLVRGLIKELDEEGYVVKVKYGSKIAYSANLSKIDELKM